MVLICGMNAIQIPHQFEQWELTITPPNRIDISLSAAKQETMLWYTRMASKIKKNQTLDYLHLNQLTHEARFVTSMMVIYRTYIFAILNILTGIWKRFSEIDPTVSELGSMLSSLLYISPFHSIQNVTRIQAYGVLLPKLWKTTVQRETVLNAKCVVVKRQQEIG